jgi:MFS transporter (putative signal transducer)
MEPSVRTTIVCVIPIYIAQAAIGGLTFVGLPAYLRQTGVALEHIGLIFLFMLPWALKFLWAGFVERLRYHRLKGDKSIKLITIGQVMMTCLIIAVLYSYLADVSVYLLIVLFVVLTLVTATVDIVCDGFVVDLLPSSKSKWGGFGQVGGAYAGFALGGGRLLWIVTQSGWGTALAALGAGILFAAVPMHLLLGNQYNRDATVLERPRPNLRAAFGKPGIWIIFFVIAMVQFEGRVLQSLQGPLLVDAGLSLKVIGTIAGFGGAFAGMLGTVFGAFLIRLLELPKAMIVCVLVQSLIAFLLSVAEVTEGAVAIAILCVSQSMVFAMIFTTLYTAMIDWARGLQSGVDFTLFQSWDAMIAVAGGLLGSMLAGYLGYVSAFLIIAGLCCATGFVLPILWQRYTSAISFKIGIETT